MIRNIYTGIGTSGQSKDKVITGVLESSVPEWDEAILRDVKNRIHAVSYKSLEKL